MKKNKIKKINIIISLIICLFFVVAPYSNAEDGKFVVSSEANGWTSKFSGTTTDEESSKAINSILGIILGVVQIIAISSAVIMLTYLGIKYMSAAPSERANIKTHLITYTIGAVLVFGAAKILELVTKISQRAIS